MSGAFPTTNLRAVMKPGMVYAVDGQRGWIYVCQIGIDRTLGFINVRNPSPQAPVFDPGAALFSRFSVTYPSITRALRSGHFLKIGMSPLHPELATPQATVTWPPGDDVSVLLGNGDVFKTRVDDPQVQGFECAAVWDAFYHLPARLEADFGVEPAEWHVGGPIWRQREVAAELKRRRGQ